MLNSNLLLERILSDARLNFELTLYLNNLTYSIYIT
jgi:hypothetical protein